MNEGFWYFIPSALPSPLKNEDTLVMPLWTRKTKSAVPYSNSCGGGQKVYSDESLVREKVNLFPSHPNPDEGFMNNDIWPAFSSSAVRFGKIRASYL